MCLRRQFLRKMSPIQLAFLPFTVCTIVLSSLTLSNTNSFLTRSVQLIFSILLQHHVSKRPNRPSNTTTVICHHLFSNCVLHVSAYRSHHQTWLLNARKSKMLINNKLICKTADSSVLAKNWIIHSHVPVCDRSAVLIYITHFSPPLPRQPPSGPGPRHCRDFTISLRHTTLGRTPLDEWSTRRSDLCQHKTLTTDRQVSYRRDSNPQSQQTSGHRDRPVVIFLLYF